MSYTNYLNKNILFLTYLCKNISFVHLISETIFELIPSKSKWNSTFAVVKFLECVDVYKFFFSLGF